MPARLLVQTPRYTYSLAPYQWVTSNGESGWRAPVGTVGGIDLRPLSAQATPGPTPFGSVFCAGRQAPASGAVVSQSNHLGSEASTTRMRDAWLTEAGYRPSGTTLLDLLWDSLTTGADPTGQAGPKPLMPNSQSLLQLHLGGHSLVRSERFQWGDSHTNRIQAVLHNDFEQHWFRNQDQARRVLDFWCEQFKVGDWKEFVPRTLHAHVPGRLKHQTTFTETWPFNGTVILTLQDQPWNEDNNDAQVSSGHLTNVTASLNVYVRCTTNLSTANNKHAATGTISTSSASNRQVGLTCRKIDSTVRTRYSIRHQRVTADFQRELFKAITGTLTLLAGSSGDLGSGALAMHVQADGSSISGAIGAITLGPVTDTGITGHLQVGCEVIGPADDTVQLDNHTAEDLAAAVRQRLYQQQQAVNRAATY